MEVLLLASEAVVARRACIARRTRADENKAEHPPPSRQGGMADHDACITLLMSRGIEIWIDPCVMVWDRKRWAGAQSDVVVRRGGRYGGGIGARLGKGAGVGVHQTF